MDDKDKIKVLKNTIERALPYIEHCFPPEPNHVCGSPDACCDGDCMSSFHISEFLLDCKKAMKL